MRLKELTSTASLGINNPTSPMPRKRWKEYLKQAVIILKNNKKLEMTNANIVTLAAVLKKKADKR